MEIKTIPKTDGFFAASTSGSIFRVKNRNGAPCAPRLLKGNARNGYRVVNLRFNGHRSTMLVHRLVALTFIGDPSGYSVCHWNHQRDDNRLSNLYIGTQSENLQQSVREGRPIGKGMTGVRPKNARLTKRDKLEIKRLYSTGNFKQLLLARLYGVTQCRVSQIVRKANDD